MDIRERIVVEANVRSGRACIRGTRIAVRDVMEYLAGGMTEDEILADFPDLTPDDLRAIRGYSALLERRIDPAPD